VSVEPRRSPALGAALVTVVLLESLRVFLPTALVVLPDGVAGSWWHAVGLAVVVLVLTPLAVAPLAQREAARVWVGAGAVSVLARGALLLDPGGGTQLVAAALGSAAGLAALVALAAGARSARAARVGIVGGMALEALLRTAFATLGPVWSRTPLATAVTVGLLTVFVVAIGRTAAHLEPLAERRPAAAWTWWWLLPALPLTGIITSSTGRVAVATGWSPGAVAAAVATAQVAAVVAALLAPRLAPATAAVIGGALTLVGTAAALPAAGWFGVLGPIAAAVGLGVLAGTEPGAGEPSDARQRAGVAALALASGHVVVLLYYLGPGWGLPGDSRILLLLLAGVAGLLASAVVRRGRFVTLRAKLHPAALLSSIGIGLVTIAALTGLVAATSRPPPPPEPDGELAVATYHLRAGFGTDGRLDPRRQAALLRAHDVDVALVTGVDRGWWLTGGHDLLPLFARELGLEHVRFVPAADEVHGHALLTRHPIAEFGTETLPGEPGRPDHRVLAAILELDDRGQIAVVGTQLASGRRGEEFQLSQIRAVAGTVARLRERDLPTILLGTFDPPEGSDTLASFEPLLTSALPEGAVTYPSPAPTELRSYVLLSPDLLGSTVEIPSSTASSHLPVIVTVERAPGPA
jgi:endonuclease/exonuclease/phosphatase family metal-dependent hydrolase